MLVIAAYDMRPPRRLADQTGMAVVVALLVLALLSLLGITLMGLSLTESQIGSNEADLKKAFFAAETGIQEAMYRMRLPATLANESTACSGTADPVVIGKQGSPPDVTWPDPTSGNFWYYNPVASQTPCPSWSYMPGPDTTPPIPPGNYFGGRAGNLDTAGRTFKFCAAGDTSAYCTSANYAHRSGNALVYSNLSNTPDPRSYEVKVRPVVGFIGGCWQYVKPYKDGAGNPVPLDGSSCTPPKLPSPFNPFFKVTSTGTAKTSSKVLSTMIRRFNVNPKPDAPLTANSDVEVTSASAIIDGHNWNCNEPPGLVGDGDLKAVAAPPKPGTDPPEPDIDTNKPENLVCEFGSGIGVSDCGRIREAFPSTIGELLLGHPYKNETSIQARLAEIDAFNAYLESIKKTPGVDTYPENVGAPFHGILYVNGNYTQPPDLSSGILIVHNSTNTANLGNWNGGTFKGVVIADGINKINGNVTIIGAVYGWGTASTVEVDITAGTPQLKYSRCVLDGLSQNFPFEVVKGTWHEQ